MSEDQPQEGASARITVVMPQEVLRAVQRRAKRKGVAPSVLIRMVVMEWLEKERGK